MLNTDLHNPCVTKKMTKSEFIKNNRGIDNGKDVPKIFLENLYHKILSDEIKPDKPDPFPEAIKRGYIFYEKRSRIIKRKIYKNWFVVDMKSDGLYAFKHEMVCKYCVHYCKS